MARILIVEDNLFIAKLLERFLTGHETALAASGEDALHVFKTQPVALVVTDVELPGLSGLDLLREVRRERDVPFVVITAGGQNEHGDYVEQANALGAVAVLEKPVQRQALLDAIAAALGEERLQDIRPPHHG